MDMIDDNENKHWRISLMNRSSPGFLLTPFAVDPQRRYMRLASLDIIRCLAILAMIILHSLMIYASPATLKQPIALFIMLCGTAPGAPTFMFIMGLLFVYSHPQNMPYYLIRGLKLVLLGYLLSLLRFILPTELAQYLGASADLWLPWTRELFFRNVDILQFAGIALGLLTLVRHFVRRPIFVMLLLIAVIMISPYLWGIKSGLAPLDWILDLLWGNGFHVSFPLFPWLVYPLAGYIFGQWLIVSNGTSAFFTAARSIGGLIFIGGVAWGLTNIGFHFGDYYRAGYGGTIAMIGFAILYVSTVELVCRRAGISGRIGMVSFLSDNLTSLYMIHWIIIGWGMLSGLPHRLSLSGCLAVIAVVSLLSYSVLVGYRYIGRRLAHEGNLSD